MILIIKQMKCVWGLGSGVWRLASGVWRLEDAPLSSKTCIRHYPGGGPNTAHHHHNMLGTPSAEDLRPISANASLWHTLWWWLDQAASTYNKLWTPS